VPLHDVVVAASLAASLAAIILAVAAETSWLAARHGARRVREAPTALVMALGSLAVAPLFFEAYRLLWPVVGHLAPAPLEAVVAAHPAIAFVVTFVAWDAAGFAYHWLGHATRVGWASHQAHHTGSTFDLTVALRQSWLPLPALVSFPLVALTGASVETAVAVAAVSNVWQALVHTSIPVRLPAWLAAVVVTPAAHRTHHDGGRAVVNLGAVLTVWDRLAGTFDDGGGRRAVAGPAPAAPGGAVALELRGWLDLAGAR
jgi:sterol desaturase/sphingolipid hydroxylase (fatty acid hydroxylase superfamily)